MIIQRICVLWASTGQELSTYTDYEKEPSFAAEEVIASMTLARARRHVGIAKTHFGDTKHWPVSVRHDMKDEDGKYYPRPTEWLFIEALHQAIKNPVRPPLVLDEHERYIVHTIGLGEGFNKIPTSLIQKGVVQVGTTPASDGKSVYPEFQLTELGLREFQRGGRVRP